MEEMPESHTLAGQIMVSLDILCDRPYVLLSSSSIHYFHNGGKAHVKYPVPSITATMEEMPESNTLAGQIMVSLDILCDRPYVLLSSSSIHYCHNGGKAHVKHPVPSITATMEEMPESHTLAGQIMVSLDILCVSIDLTVSLLCPVIIQFHPLPPQWRRCQKGTYEASSSIHYRHNGGKAHVKPPVPSITTTLEEMPERHTLAGQIMVSLDILCDRPYVVLSSSSIHYRHNGGDARKAHVKHPVPSITATMEEIPERHT